jgi:hypothetical protein
VTRNETLILCDCGAGPGAASPWHVPIYGIPIHLWGTARPHCSMGISESDLPQMSLYRDGLLMHAGDVMTQTASDYDLLDILRDYQHTD